ncbi:hypothetical protein Q4543_08860 [Salipiger sp. 1_MG-2023]|uniref:hypothetical protein n=1 Tax=Salipiger sp. 1_MG-2023 TaxID=3062665 RepID=UPI0026E2495C|nr:hypothetical protein [Salipiger sp. 1_MG-2023]MDO6585628.1 hypothetical protein [Salipiger sp. 1_MG-2023]
MNYPDNQKPAPFARVPDKVGCKHYHLYVAMTEDGPVHYAMGLDDEGDEFEIEIHEGCAKLLTHNRNYLMLTDQNLADMRGLIEWAKDDCQAWAETEMGKAFNAMLAGELSVEDEAAVRAQFDRLLGTRREVLVQ